MLDQIEPNPLPLRHKNVSASRRDLRLCTKLDRVTFTGRGAVRPLGAGAFGGLLGLPLLVAVPGKFRASDVALRRRRRLLRRFRRRRF